jgi:hypothetical protein
VFHLKGKEADVELAGLIHRIQSAASLSVWEPSGKGSPVLGLREAGKEQEGSPEEAGKRPERPKEAEVHPNN